MNTKTAHIDFYFTPKDTWDAMYADCQAAKESIIFEQYIWENRDFGKKLMELMIEKAKQGVSIRLLLDRIGSRELFKSPIVEELRQHGGTVRFYNPIDWINIVTPHLWFPRNHTKALVIDAQTAYVGSVCVADEMTHWRDLQLRITGPLAKQVHDTLSASKSALRKQWLQFLRKGVPHTKNRFALSLPRFLPNPIYKELRQQIRQAKQSVLLASPYFLPPWRLRRELRKAVQRGVNVSVLMGYKTDVPIADLVARSYFPRLLRAGIKLYLYKPTVMHAKYVVVDDTWATVGSMNIDYLSMLHNREANILLYEAEPVATLRAHFEDDVKDSKPATRSDWDNLPLPYKIIGRLGRVMKQVL